MGVVDWPMPWSCPFAGPEFLDIYISMSYLIVTFYSDWLEIPHCEMIHKILQTEYSGYQTLHDQSVEF